MIEESIIIDWVPKGYGSNSLTKFHNSSHQFRRERGQKRWTRLLDACTRWSTVQIGWIGSPLGVQTFHARKSSWPPPQSPLPADIYGVTYETSARVSLSVEYRVRCLLQWDLMIWHIMQINCMFNLTNPHNCHVIISPHVILATCYRVQA